MQPTQQTRDTKPMPDQSWPTVLYFLAMKGIIISLRDECIIHTAIYSLVVIWHRVVEEDKI